MDSSSAFAFGEIGLADDFDMGWHDVIKRGGLTLDVDGSFPTTPLY
jgi:hypothetical protein